MLVGRKDEVSAYGRARSCRRSVPLCFFIRYHRRMRGACMSSRSFCRRTILSAGFFWFAGSLAVTSLSAAGNSPAALERREHSKEAVAWKVIKLQIPARNGLVPLRAELADTESKRERGLMFRRSLSENSGMLFVFDPPAQAAFWMKNTRIPLSIAFLDSQGRILEIRSMRPFDETVIWSASNAVAYALEVNEGWFDYHGIQTGTKIYGIPSIAERTERRTNSGD